MVMAKAFGGMHSSHVALILCCLSSLVQANYYICGNYPHTYYSYEPCRSSGNQARREVFKCDNGLYKVNLACDAHSDCWKVDGTCEEGRCCSPIEGAVNYGCPQGTRNVKGLTCQQDWQCEYFEYGKPVMTGKCHYGYCCMDVSLNHLCPRKARSMGVFCKDNADCKYIDQSNRTLTGTCAKGACCTSTALKPVPNTKKGEAQPSPAPGKCLYGTTAIRLGFKCIRNTQCQYEEPQFGNRGKAVLKSGICVEGQCCQVIADNHCMSEARKCKSAADCRFTSGNRTIVKQCRTSDGRCCDFEWNRCPAGEIYTAARCSIDAQCGGSTQEGRCRLGRCCLITP